MRVIFTLILSMIFLFTVKGQEKKDLTVSLSRGFLTSAYYPKANASGLVGVDFEYHLTSKHILSADYLIGKHLCFEKDGSNNIGYGNGRNALVKYNIFSVLYKNKIIAKSKFNILTGIGAGVMHKTQEYYYKGEDKDYLTILSKSFFVVPVSLNLNYKVAQHWQFGLEGGFFLEPGVSMLSALHAGPRIAFVLP